MSTARPPIAYHCRLSVESLIRLNVNVPIKWSKSSGLVIRGRQNDFPRLVELKFVVKCKVLFFHIILSTPGLGFRHLYLEKRCILAIVAFIRPWAESTSAERESINTAWSSSSFPMARLICFNWPTERSCKSYIANRPSPFLPICSSPWSCWCNSCCCCAEYRP